MTFAFTALQFALLILASMIVGGAIAYYALTTRR
jgi:hypothetical protein